MERLSRRSFVKIAGVAAGTAAIGAAPPLARAAAGHDAEQVEPATGVPEEPLVAYVRDVERPPALGEMIAIAEVLGAETDFVRVDHFCPGDRIVFGELTNYPLAGAGTFRPAQFDHELGKWWTPPKSYR